MAPQTSGSSQETSTKKPQSITSSKNSPITPPKSVPSKIYPGTDSSCAKSDQHNIGLFCTTCFGFHMPWGEHLPSIDKSAGLINYGAAESVIAGLNLKDPTAIATLCALLYLNKTGAPLNTVPGIQGYMDQYPAAVTGSIQTLKLETQIQERTRQGETVPQWWDIVNLALQYPHLKPKKLRIRIQEFLDASYNDQADTLAAEDAGGELVFTKRAEVTGTKSRRPAPKGNWRFLEGSDLEDAVLGHPDPSKFILLREDIDGKAAKDCREYPHWKTFNWDSKADITHLNKARHQIIYRTRGPVNGPRLPWTEAEHKQLKKLIEPYILAGVKKTKLPWEQITKDLNNHFANKTQLAGSPLARTSIFTRGGGKIPDQSPVGKLLKDRKGSANRSYLAVANMSTRLADIHMMIRGGKDALKIQAEQVNKKRKAKDYETDDDETEFKVEEEIETKVEPKKKAQLIRLIVTPEKDEAKAKEFKRKRLNPDED